MIACLLENASLRKPPPFVKKVKPSEPAGAPVPSESASVIEPAPAPPAAGAPRYDREHKNAVRRARRALASQADRDHHNALLSTRRKEAKVAKKMADSAVAATPCASVCG